jgi:NAD(P)-dependent dehydrogenase (short-subunit alcohol dehydrogenase family)
MSAFMQPGKYSDPDLPWFAQILPQCRALLQIQDSRLQCLQVDVTIEDQIAAAAKIMQESGRLDLVVNCAGVLHTDYLQPEKSLRHIESNRLLQYFQINSISAVLWAKHLQPLFKHSEKSIFASISAKVGSIGGN